jgi:hypothetical protein
LYIQISLLTRSEEVRLARQREEKEREWRDKQLELARQKKEQQEEVSLLFSSWTTSLETKNNMTTLTIEHIFGRIA